MTARVQIDTQRELNQDCIFLEQIRRCKGVILQSVGCGLVVVLKDALSSALSLDSVVCPSGASTSSGVMTCSSGQYIVYVIQE